MHSIIAEVGPGSIVEVTIQSSDNAYGTFEIAENSLEIETPEAEIGYSAANIQVSLPFQTYKTYSLSIKIKTNSLILLFECGFMLEIDQLMH